MDCFIQDLLRDKLLLSVNDEGNDNINEVASSDDDIIISTSVNAKEKFTGVTITAPNDDVGTGPASTSLHHHHHHHHPHCRLFVDIVTDNANVFAEARPYVFSRAEDKKTQIIDRWDAIHGIHNNNNYISDNNYNDMSHLRRRRRAMSDSRLLVIPDRRWKQQHRDFRRVVSDSMLVIPTRSWKQHQAVKRCSELATRTTTKKIIPESLPVFSWNNKTNYTRDTKGNLDGHSLHHRPHQCLFVDLVTDNDRVFAGACSKVSHRMEGNKTHRWDANHVTHDNNDIDNNDIKRVMSDSRLVIPDGRWKQQLQCFSRETSDSMMVIPKRIVSDYDESSSRDTKINFDERKKYSRFGQSIPTSSSAKLSAIRNSAIPPSLFPKHLLITDIVSNILTFSNHKWPSVAAAAAAAATTEG